jgi:hypothetical protein
MLYLPKLFAILLFWALMAAMWSAASLHHIGAGYTRVCYTWSDTRYCHVLEAPAPVRAWLDRQYPVCLAPHCHGLNRIFDA